jgi:hypothetical protein
MLMVERGTSGDQLSETGTRSITVVDSLSIVIDLPLPGRTLGRATVAFD